MRTHAVCLIWMGWTIAGLAGLGALVVTVATVFRPLAAVFVVAGVPDRTAGVFAAVLVLAGAVVLGMALGTPFIIAGELVRIALDQRRVLLDQARTLRRLRAKLAPATTSRGSADVRPAPLLNLLTPR